MIYDVSIKIPRNKLLPDVFAWLEVDNDLHWRQDWTYEANHQNPMSEFIFKFNEQANAVLFALKWS